MLKRRMRKAHSRSIVYLIGRKNDRYYWLHPRGDLYEQRGKCGNIIYAHEQIDNVLSFCRKLDESILDPAMGDIHIRSYDLCCALAPEAHPDGRGVCQVFDPVTRLHDFWFSAWIDVAPLRQSIEDYERRKRNEGQQ